MPKYRVVAINETGMCSEKFVEKLKGGKVYSRYLYDPTVCTHCCELTPSYELRFLGSEFWWADEMQEEELESIYNELLEADCHTEPVVYMHCRDVEKMKFYEVEADDIEEAFESARGNVGFPEGL